MALFTTNPLTKKIEENRQLMTGQSPATELMTPVEIQNQAKNIIQPQKNNELDLSMINETSKQLEKQQQINKEIADIPEPQDTTTSTVAGFQAQNQDLSDRIKALRQPTAEEIRLEQEQDDLQSALLKRLEPSMTERREDLVSEADLARKEQELTDLSKRIANLDAQFKQEQLNIEQSGTTARGVAVRSADLNQRRAVELGKLTALAEIAQGNIETAYSNINQILNLEFQDQENSISRLQTILDINKENLTKAELKRAEELESVLAQQQDLIDQQKEERGAIYDLALTAKQNGADNATVQKMFNAQTREEALQMAGDFLQEPETAENQELLSPTEAAALGVPFGTTKGQAFGISPKTQLTGQDKIDLEVKLANNFENYAKESRTAERGIETIETGYNEALKALKEGKSLNAQSQAVIIGFNKLIDPTSVVRESEYARTPEGASLLNRIEGKVQQIKFGGAGITQDDLETIKDTATALLSGYKDQQLNFAQRVQTQANNYGLNIENILTPDILQDLQDFEQREFTQQIDNQIDLILQDPQYKGASEDEILEILMEVEQEDFSPVGGDTNQASNIQIGAGIAKRTNNPGNLVFIGQKGAIRDPQGGRFAMFNTPQEGFQALMDDINAKKDPYGTLNSNSTLAEMISVYAPPSENDTRLYISQISKALGINPNTPIGQIPTYDLAREIAKKESSTIIT